MSNPADLETAKMFAQEEMADLERVWIAKFKAAQRELQTSSFATAAELLKSLSIVAKKSADYIATLDSFDSKKEFERDGF
jgi:acyl-CoA reductase-like NAD-dependent aldehyde dehydrogenase